MAESNHAPIAVRFGPFQVSFESGELRRNGVRVKLSGQAIDLLLTLLENPGRVVSREELQRRLWPDASFGDFDHGLNAAVNRLREVLADSATQPTFIETVPRRGYRFIGEIQPDRSPDDLRPTDVPPGEKVCPDRKAPARPRFGRRWRFGTAAAAVLLVVYTSAYHLRREPPRPETHLTVVPLTTFPGLEMMPSFSPDGTQIAFAWYREFGRSMAADLYVKQIGNEHAVRLTNHEARYVVPAWSPDGRSIAFAMAGKSGNGIYIMPSLGGPDRLLARLADNYWQYLLLSWSPDSRVVAFTSDAPTAEGNATPGRFRIHLVDIATGEERLLPPPSPDCWIMMEPAFSPDGTYLASVCVLNESVNKIYVQRPDGGDAREVAVVNNARVLNGIGWSPDSKSIVYGGKKSYGPQASADGKRVFFVVGGEIDHGDRDALWSVSVEGGDQRPERGMPTLRLGAAWAPAQGGIYFIAGSESNFVINYFDFATNHVHKVTDLPGLSSVLGGMAVTQNNDMLLFTGIDHGEADIMLVEGFR